MKKVFFKDAESKDHAILMYKEFAKHLHPLKGGKPEIWQQITAEYNALNFDPEPVNVPVNLPANEQVKKPVPPPVIEAAQLAAKLPGCKVEILGRWAWVTGNTLSNWQTLKSAGFYFSAKKQACYFHMPEDKIVRRTGRQLPLEDIEKKYQKQLF